ncbi:hypothetical protein CWE13_08960 [Aliidiomarina shirensis]|uniref:Uncharacterized protein n=1 Tax=Aliidiomarina shirensis TaxID=1048642 RepID=A0A432WT87_9GAMM|nr:hypothetical protein [Aliidiomarina shirensis]RUO36964.1 hypothetical protein CWE13_08960 [Aliidiomarina shirensis]
MCRLILVFIVVLLSGCSSINVPLDSGSAEDNFGYHPLDPLPVQLNIPNGEVLNALSDETMRLAIGTVTREGSLTFGPAKLGVEGKNYVVILDYIKFSTDSLPVSISENPADGKRIATLLPQGEEDLANTVVPVYIGVGLRLTANIFVKKGEIDLSSLFALGVAARAEQVSGTLIIQTLGVSGQEISSLIPMPSEISESSIQNAMLALASIKVKMYDDNTQITPRVVGVYNNLGGGQTTINGFISSLLQRPILFPRPPANE